MARVLLVVPSSTYKVADFLDAARQLGADVVVAGEEAHVLAGAEAGRTMVVDFENPVAGAAAIVDHEAHFPLDAVVAVDDRGTLLAAAAARRLGLPHNPAEAVRATRDKRLMRKRLEAAEVPQPAYVELPPTAEEDELVRLAAKVGYPCVVKPATLSASLGVLRVDDPASLPATVSRVRRIAGAAGVPDGESLLAERFVPGPELAVEALLDRGRLEPLAIFDKPDPLDGPAFEETIYVTPSRLPAADQQAALSAVESATRALGLGEGPVHAEVRVSDGRALVIEVAARTIGGLCGRALAFGTGHSLEELVLAQALGVSLTDRRPDTRSSGVLMIPIPRAGTLRSVEGRQAALAVPGVTAVDITIAPGRRLAPPPEGGRYLGFVFARARRPQEVEKALRTAGALLDVQIDPIPVTSATPAETATTGAPTSTGGCRS